MPGTVVFFHAHPDDEAIFTGGTLALLADAGVRTSLVVATMGEAGASGGFLSGPALGRARAAETRLAAAELGSESVHFLGFRDSGLHTGNPPGGSFAAEPVESAAGRLAEVLKGERAEALVVYDERGIYGHPDHVQVHEVGVAAAELAGVPTVYEVTVDREYLHFVETHLVEDAGRAAARQMAGGDSAGPPSTRGRLGLAAMGVGMASVEIDLTIDVRAVIDRKRAAIASHGSQLPAGSPVMQLPHESFCEVYGWEWYRRRTGPAAALDRLSWG